ncbi:hypothetical protein AB837_00643 [bacterium AB1]|nr:hypothetical protein AB837_00643 [bacterium AB1]
MGNFSYLSNEVIGEINKLAITDPLILDAFKTSVNAVYMANLDNSKKNYAMFLFSKQHILYLQTICKNFKDGILDKFYVDVTSHTTFSLPLNKELEKHQNNNLAFRQNSDIHKKTCQKSLQITKKLEQENKEKDEQLKKANLLKNIYLVILISIFTFTSFNVILYYVYYKKKQQKNNKQKKQSLK